MEFVTALACGLLGICVMSALFLIPVRRRLAKELRAATDAEVRGRVFRYEREYFQVLGENHPDVAAFRGLVEGEYLDGIRANWRRLSKSFLRLERESGHHGRPLIMDY